MVKIMVKVLNSSKRISNQIKIIATILLKIYSAKYPMKHWSY